MKFLSFDIESSLFLTNHCHSELGILIIKIIKYIHSGGFHRHWCWRRSDEAATAIGRCGNGDWMARTVYNFLDIVTFWDNERWTICKYNTFIVHHHWHWWWTDGSATATAQRQSNGAKWPWFLRYRNVLKVSSWREIGDLYVFHRHWQPIRNPHGGQSAWRSIHMAVNHQWAYYS